MSKHISRKLTREISELSGLPIDVVCSAPVFQMFSDREIFIEDVKNLEYYDENCVKAMTDRIRVTVIGRGLSIKCLSEKNLSVGGTITGIELEEI